MSVSYDRTHSLGLRDVSNKKRYNDFVVATPIDLKLLNS